MSLDSGCLGNPQSPRVGSRPDESGEQGSQSVVSECMNKRQKERHAIVPLPPNPQNNKRSTMSTMTGPGMRLNLLPANPANSHRSSPHPIWRTDPVGHRAGCVLSEFETPPRRASFSGSGPWSRPVGPSSMHVRRHLREAQPWNDMMSGPCRSGFRGSPHNLILTIWVAFTYRAMIAAVKTKDSRKPRKPAGLEGLDVQA